MTAVKICGIRREEDVRYLNRYLPDYAGFVFAKSRRRVTPDQASNLAKMLDKRILRVGVFVNESLENLFEIFTYCKLDVIQLHGDETSGYIISLKELINRSQTSSCALDINKNEAEVPCVEVWKALRIKDKLSNELVQSHMVDGFILDSYSDKAYGGTGKTFDWNIAAEVKNKGKAILAGGLNTENVAKAVQLVKPFAVDVSSGVETNGYKDEIKVMEFIRQVRSCKEV